MTDDVRRRSRLDRALREHLSLGHNVVGSEHILSGPARESEGVPSRILRHAGVDAEKIRNDTVRPLAGPAAADVQVRAPTRPARGTRLSAPAGGMSSSAVPQRDLDARP